MVFPTGPQVAGQWVPYPSWCVVDFPEGLTLRVGLGVLRTYLWAGVCGVL